MDTETRSITGSTSRFTFPPQVNNSLDFLWLEITSKCNLNCVHCYAESTPLNPLRGKMTYVDWVRVIHQGFESGCRRIQFIGGEPTLHPDLLRLISVARDTGYEFVEVYTNGTTLSDELVSEFKERKVSLAISVYSDDATVHDKITLRPGSHPKTIAGIKRAVGHGVPVRVGLIEMEENSDDLTRTVNYLKELGVQEVRIDKKRGIGRGRNGFDSDDSLSELCGHCWEGKLAVDADGNVFPCVFSKFHAVGLADEGLSEILSKDSLLSFRKSVHEMSDTRTQRMTCSPYDDDACQPDDQKSCGPHTGCNPDYCTPTQRHCNPDNCTPSK